MFWAHRNQLLGSDRDSLPSLVGQIVSQEKISSQEDRKGAPTPVGKVDGQLLLCSVSDLPTINDIITGSEETAYLILSPSESGNQLPTSNPLISRIPLTPGKKGQAEFLHSALPQSVNFIHRQLSEGRRICVACETGKDSSVGVVLAALQLFFTDSGHLALPTSRPDVNITKRKDCSFSTSECYVLFKNITMYRCGQRFDPYSTRVDNSQSTLCKPVKNNFETCERISAHTTGFPFLQVLIGSEPLGTLRPDDHISDFEV